MAVHAHTTRRALFAAAPATALIGVAAPALASPGPLERLLAERNRLTDWINAEPDWGAARDSEREAIFDRIFAMEDAIALAPPTTDAVRARLALEIKLDAEGRSIDQEYVIGLLKQALPYVRRAY